MIISHDRSFMDTVATHTLGIHRCGVRKVAGPTINFDSLITEEEALYERTRINQERKIAHTEEFINRFRAKASKARSVQSRIKALERMQQLDALNELPELDFRFPYSPLSGKWVLHIDELSFAYRTDQPLIKGLSASFQAGEKIGVIGKNGQGKSTLLRLIKGELTAQKGRMSWAQNVRVGYFGQTNIEQLDPNKTVEEEIFSVDLEQSRTRVRTLCGLMMFSGDDALKKVALLSGGERARVLLGKLLAAQSNVLLLDEPTNHLDVQATESLINAANEFSGMVMLVTHSESILRAFARKLIVFDDHRCIAFDGGYDDFLARIGWQGEQIFNAEQARRTEGNKKRERRQRAALLQERTKQMRPWEEKISALEEEIHTLEEQVKREEARLTELAESTYTPEAAALAKSAHQNRLRIDLLFDDLENATRSYQEAAARLQEKRHG
jgi:ATP-binding cassette subfamily F protein 3